MLTYVLYPQLHKVDFCSYVSFMDEGTEEQRSDLTLLTNLGHSGAWIWARPLIRLALATLLLARVLSYHDTIIILFKTVESICIL